MQFRLDPEFLVYPYLVQSGLKPYTQIIDQHFPGGFFLPVNFASLGFVTPESFLRLHILIVALLCLLILKITKSVWSAVLFLAFWPLFDGSHLWVDTFVALFSIAAYYFSTQKKWFAVGLNVALAVIFKQSLILLIFPFLFASPLVYLPTLFIFLYFSFIFSFRDFWYITGIFNFIGYAGKAFFVDHFPKWIFIFAPTIILIKKYPLIFYFLAVTLIGFLARPDAVHLQPAAPFLAVLVFYFFRHYAPKILPFYVILMAFLSLFKEVRVLNTRPAGYEDNTQKVIDFVKANTQKNQEIFLLGAQPHIYFYTNTLPAGKFFVYHMPWYMKIYQDRQLSVLQTSLPKIIIFDIEAQVDNQSIFTYASKLTEFTHQNYNLRQTFGNYSIYLKNTE